MATRDTVPGLAARLRTAREASKLTQVEAGAKSGVHHISIAKFETDKTAPTLRVLYRLAAAYGVKVCDLLPPDGDVMKAIADEQ
jgi:transcriptional regulator with XRE-family HTH domain